MVSSIIPILRTFGDVAQVALPAYVGIRAVNKGQTEEGLALGVAAGIQQVVLFSLKAITAIPRPSPYQMRFDAFPSGHTAGAFLAVGFMIAMSWIQPEDSSLGHKVTIVALAVLVGLSRVLSHMHWVIDVVCGGSIGIAFGAASVLVPYLIKYSSGTLDTTSSHR